MQNSMSVKQFKHLIKTQMKRIEDISCDVPTSTYKIYENYNESNSFKLDLSKFYNYEKKIETNIQMSIWSYLTEPQSIGCWKLFKAHNIQLNYQFIKFVVESEYPGTKIFRWLLANSDYINQFLPIPAYSHVFTNLNEFSDIFGEDYRPVKFEEFIYQCLQNQDFNKVDIIAKTNYDINENNLLERIVVEFNNDSDWDVGYLLNLFALKPSFNFNCINSFLKMKLIYLVLDNESKETLNKYYPNILANKNISAYIKGEYPESEYQLSKAKLKEYFVIEHKYNAYNRIYENDKYDQMIIISEPDDNIIYDPLEKYVYNIQIGPEIFCDRFCKVILEDFNFYLQCIKNIY